MADNTTGTGSAPHTGCFYCSTAKPIMQHVWNEATRNHFRNSRIEFLKGLRSLIDNRIDHLSRNTESKGSHVVVE